MSKLVPIISVLGAPGSGKRSLVSSLTGSSAVVNDRDARWSIHTKYYSADVAFRVQACGPSASSAPAFEGEAIVLVFDATCQSSFSAIQSWASSNSESTEDAGVRLVVATHADRYLSSGDAQPHHPGAQQAISSQHGANNSSTALSPARPQWLMDAMDWCAGECFEYVECCNTDAALDQQLCSEEGDVQGIARITEALQAHMWPGLVMRELAGKASSNLHQRSQGVGASSDKDTSCAAGEGVEERHGAECQNPLASQSTPEPPRVLRPPCASRGHEEGSFGGVGSQPQQPLTDGEQQQQQQQDCSPNEACQGAQHHAHSQSTSKGVEQDGWEKLMEQMAAAKQQCHRLPDEQRRAQAAALAMRFASMLGSDSEEDGRSSDSGS